MAHKYRKEVVGKRFLALSLSLRANPSDINSVDSQNWTAGVIRASSESDITNKETQV